MFIGVSILESFFGSLIDKVSGLPPHPVLLPLKNGGEGTRYAKYSADKNVLNNRNVKNYDRE